VPGYTPLSGWRIDDGTHRALYGLQNLLWADAAMIREQEGRAQMYRPDRAYRVSLTVKLPPRQTTWFVIKAPRK